VSLWSRELETHVQSFVSQAVQVAAWDSAMLDNFKKIVQLQNQVRNVQAAQTQLHALLATIQAHQQECHQMLDQLESQVEALPPRANPAPEEMRREEAFALAEQIDRDLLNMSDALASTVSSLNASTERSLAPTNPLSSVLKILNVHQDALGWLDGTARDVSASLAQTQRAVQQLQVQEQTSSRARAEFDQSWQRHY